MISDQGLDACLTTHPFPGLRPFLETESDIFFGRREQTVQLLERLGTSRFLAVVGPSGCGKSSLVRAGLIAELTGGAISEAGSHWQVLSMRPGGDPIGAMACALDLARGLPDEGSDERLATLCTHLLQTPRALGNEIEALGWPERTNVLLLVDQFEELLRLHRRAERDRDREPLDAFVGALLAATQTALPIYVVLTMRSDYLGDCARFDGLPEAVSGSQFLTPKLSREQCRQAIVGPTRVFDGEIGPALVNRILNEMDRAPDQLPLLQHVMMRMWDRASQDETRGRPVEMTEADYEAVGGLQKALSNHADEVYEQELSEDQQRVAERLFRVLTERGAIARDARRMLSVETIARTLCPPYQGGPEEVAQRVGEVIAVAEAFRQTGRHFITPAPPTPLHAETVLDIGHECLIQKWARLNQWATEEARAADRYRRVVREARLWKEGEAELFTSTNLAALHAWREKQQPNRAWTELYGDEQDMQDAKAFWEASEAAEEQRREAERRRAEEEQQRRDDERALTAQRRLDAQALIAQRRIMRWKLNFYVMAALVIVIGVAAYLVKGNHDQAIAAGWAEATAHVSDDYARALEHGLTMYVHDHDDARVAKLRNIVEHAPTLAALLPRQPGMIYAVAFSPRQPLLAVGTGTADPQLSLWDVKQPGQPRWLDTLKLPTPLGINCLAFSPQRRLLAAGTSDGTLYLWDDQSLHAGVVPLARKGLGSAITRMAFSPDSELLALACDRGAKVLALTNPTEPSTVAKLTKETALDVAFSPDGRELAIGLGDGHVLFRDPRGGRETRPAWQGHSQGVFALVYTPDGGHLVTGSADSTLRSTELKAPPPQGGLKSVLMAGHQRRIWQLAISPDGRTVASASADKTVRLWDPELGIGLGGPLTAHGDQVDAVAFSPDGSLLASASDDHRVALWDLTLRRRYGTDERSVTGLDVADDGTLLVAGLSGHLTRWRWQPERAELQRDGPTRQPDEGSLPAQTALALAPDGRTVLTGRGNGAVSWWDAERLRVLTTWPAYRDGRGGDGVPRAVALDVPNRRVAVVYGDCAPTAVALYDLAGHLTDRTPSSVGDPSDVALSPDGRLLALASLGWAPRVWDLRGEHPLATTAFRIGDDRDEVASVAFSPRGGILAVGYAKDIGLWDLSDLRQPKLKARLVGHTNYVRALAFTRDGRRLASGSRDGTVILWNADSGQALTPPLRAHQDEVFAVRFLPGAEARYLVSGGADGALVLWDLQLEQWRAQHPEVIARQMIELPPPHGRS